MFEQVTRWLEERFNLSQEQVLDGLRQSLLVVAAMLFIILSTLIIAFDSIFLGVNNIANLQSGSIAPRDIVAPPNPAPYVSSILTDQARLDAGANVLDVYFPPDPEIRDQQTDLAIQVLDYISTVREDDIYPTLEQRIVDVNAITVLKLDERNIETMLQLDGDTWNAVEDEVTNVLTRMMRPEIRPDNLTSILTGLSNQISSRFNARERNVVVDIVQDLIVPNVYINTEATELAREAAATAVQPQTRRFIGGQIIVRENEPIDALTYEALQAMNLLQSNDSRRTAILRALVVTLISTALVALYWYFFERRILLYDTPMVLLIGTIYLFMLTAVRLGGISGEIYLFPYTAMALLLVAIAGQHIAISTSFGLALVAGVMAGDSLQIAALITAGSIVGALLLRSTERPNQFFIAGGFVGLMNMALVGLFSLPSVSDNTTLNLFFRYLAEGFVSGIFIAPATAFGLMFIVTALFNLPTALKLIELSQPNKPLLQRLLREAPGTYQHSLQVANLAEQAASAIGGDAQLTHVAALYHDIGKMGNPIYFTENQQDIGGNPHDALNDPYRSADIIISHITDGDEMAKTYRLPNRLRDFIREHHGTTEVFVFYQQARRAMGGDEDAVDASDFRYPGPKPRSKETAILMMADSCEAAVRSVKPTSKQQIRELVTNIINGKRDSGQLNDSGLTLNDLQTIREIFVDILQSIFHPRINYQDALDKKPEPAPKPVTTTPPPETTTKATSNGAVAASKPATEKTAPKPSAPKPVESATVSNDATKTKTKHITTNLSSMDDAEIADEEPMSEVPRLPSIDERRATGLNQVISNGDDEKDSDA